MPVSPQGFETWIEVEGRRLEEFKVELAEDKVVCWVPCDPGKEFRIGCAIPAGRMRLMNHSAHIFLDGNRALIESNLFRHAPNTPNSVTRYFEKELVKNDTATRTFHFGSLELTDDDSYLLSTTKRFGEVSVDIGTLSGFVERVSALAAPKPGEDYRIHERAKKGLAHCIKFGEEKLLAVPPPVLDPVGLKKVFTFVFNYRHMDILVADGIAPRKVLVPVHENAVASSSRNKPPGINKQTSGKRKLDEVKEEDQVAQDLLEPTDEEIQRVEAQLATMKARKTQGAGYNAEPPAKRVKQEPKSAFVPGETIDLTNLPSGSGSLVKQEPKFDFLPGEIIDLT